MARQIEQEYYIWITDLVKNWITNYGEYNKIIDYLYSREFYSLMDYDENRATDGKGMRLKFVEQHDRYNYRDAYLYLSGSCTILELMAALAMKCEEQIMHDFVLGDRSGIWFYTMLCSLGFGEMTDDIFDEEQAKTIIDRFLNREYSSNGEGGLFVVNNPPADLRTVDIWYQLHYYLRTFD